MVNPEYSVRVDSRVNIEFCRLQSTRNRVNIKPGLTNTKHAVNIRLDSRSMSTESKAESWKKVFLRDRECRMFEHKLST